MGSNPQPPNLRVNTRPPELVVRMTEGSEAVETLEGYIHQVDHDPAGFHAEAVSLDVTSCGGGGG